MIIGEKEINEIIVTGKDDEVLAVIKDNEIVEKKGVNVTLECN